MTVGAKAFLEPLLLRPIGPRGPTKQQRYSPARPRRPMVARTSGRHRITLPCASSNDVDVELLRAAEGAAVVGVYEQIVGTERARREGGLRQLRCRDREGRARRLHQAVDREVTARLAGVTRLPRPGSAF
jgi:hypothetical protein